ncbi:MAG TPA: hypothetical protein ENN19_00615 [Chloroflexi bacterium]|nr:hypothetical protein [Chloroflexota bacterium]
MAQLSEKRAFDQNRVMVVFLIGVFWLAFALRWVYFLNTNRVVDEYISMLSIRAILVRGLPILPSGWLYGPKGLTHGYLGALSALAFGRSAFALCFQSVAAGMLAVSLIYRIGRDCSSADVGLSAAVALACLPSAVQWGGRVRMYSLWQLLSLLGVYLLVKGYLGVGGADRRARIGGLLAMSLAMLTHTLTLMALGGLLVGLGVAWIVSLRKRRPCSTLRFSPGEILAVLFLVAVIVVSDPLGGPWGGRVKMSEVALQGTLTMRHVQERLFYLVAYTHEFVTWPLWPLTIFYAEGFIRLGLNLLRIRKAVTADDWAALSLYILLLVVWFTTGVTAHIQRDRYLFAILPFFLLLSLREIVAIVRLLGHTLGGLGNSGVLVAILLLALLTPSATRTIRTDVIGDLSLAYRYVEEHWRPGDAIAAYHPAPSQWFLNRVDYYATDVGAGVHDGVDAWAGAPWVPSPEAFALVLDAHGRVWYVVDDAYWDDYLGDAFKQFVRRRMRVAYHQSGVQVFVHDSNSLR